MNLRRAVIFLVTVFGLAACASSGAKFGSSDPNAPSKPFDHELDVRGGGG